MSSWFYRKRKKRKKGNVCHLRRFNSGTTDENKYTSATRRRQRQTWKTACARGRTSRLPRFPAIAYRQYVRLEFSHRLASSFPPAPSSSSSSSVLVKLRGGESRSAVLRLFHRGYLPPPAPSPPPTVAIHPYGGNKAPNKRFPSRWTERTNGKSDISMPRRPPPSSCFFPPPHRIPPLPSTILSRSFGLRSPSPCLLPRCVYPQAILSFITFIFSFHPPLFLHSPPPSAAAPSRTHSHIHRNWPFTTAGITISQSR